MGNMDQHPHSRGEHRSVGNHPVPSVEAEMTGSVTCAHVYGRNKKGKEVSCKSLGDSFAARAHDLSWEHSPFTD